MEEETTVRIGTSPVGPVPSWDRGKKGGSELLPRKLGMQGEKGATPATTITTSPVAVHHMTLA